MAQADKFTTGALHPLSPKLVVLPSNLVPDAAHHIDGAPGRSSADDSDIWARCMLLLPRLVEIGRDDPC